MPVADQICQLSIRSKFLMIEDTSKKHYMAWMTLAMLDFVTIIRFEDVFYPYQNQGLSVIFPGSSF